MRLAPDTRFDTFTILRRLGRGGMATVYLAREDRPNRQVALKVLPEHFGDEDGFLARFEQEAELIANLDHPNIIPLYRYGVTDDVPWMALRYVDGGDLAERLARPLAIAEGLDILRAVAAALDYAHRRGIVHRDLKPQNVLLSTDHATYLADFGIAKMLEGSQRLKTATGGVLGTPAYMAPEQAQGHTLGPYTDAYAFAVISFQWLIGALPFDADTPHAILMKHVLEPLPAERLALLPERVAAVLRRGLAKQPDERHASVGELFRDLEAALHSGYAAAPEPAAIRPGEAPVATVITPPPLELVPARKVAARSPPAQPSLAADLTANEDSEPAGPRELATTPPLAIAAGFLRRLVAWQVDALLVGVPLFFAWWLLSLWRAAVGFDNAALDNHLDGWLIAFWRYDLGISDASFVDPRTLLIDLLALLLYVVGNAWLESGPRQASVGKRLLTLKVCDRGGHRLSFFAALARQWMRLLVPFSAGVGALVAARGPRYLTWHDRMSGTRVVSADARPDDLDAAPAAHRMVLPWPVALVATLLAVPCFLLLAGLSITVADQVDYFCNQGVREVDPDIAEVRRDAYIVTQWIRKDNGADINRADAIAYCAALPLDGGGWHLADLGEMLWLRDDSGWVSTPCRDTTDDGSGAATTCHVSPLFRLSGNRYWTSYIQAGSEQGWIYPLDGGLTIATTFDASKGMRALCTRSPPAAALP